MTPRALLLGLAGLLVALAGCPGPGGSPRPPAPASRPAAPPDERAYWKGRADLIQPPTVAAAEALRTPGLQRFRLSNQLGVVVLPDRTLPLVDISVVIRTGSIDDQPEKVGLAEFTAGMLRQGTRRFGADQISSAIDSAGARLGAASDYELSSVSCSARSKVLDLCLEMLAELVQRPSFPAKEMDEIRERLLGSVKETRDDPASLAALHFNNLLYGDDHPAGRPMTVESLQSIRREDLVDFHRRHYLPGNLLIGAAGDVDPADLQRRLERAFGKWQGKPATPTSFTPVKDPPAGLRVLLVDKPDLSQSFFALGHNGIKRNDPDREAVMLANYVLGGGGFSSRLMQVVRSEGGKTYSISSQFDEGTHDGSFVVQSFTRNDQLVATLQLVRQELARLGREPPTQAELRLSKGDLAGGFPIRLQTRAGIVARLLRAQIFGLPDSFVTELPLRVQRLGPVEVTAAARRHVHPDRLVAAVVGKAAVVAPLLKAAGIRFEQVSYLDPISAAERKRQQQPATPTITPAEMKRARPILQRMLATAGGRERLALIRSLRLSGPGQVEEVKGTYSLTLRLPDALRIVFDFKAGAMVQVLAGKQAFIQVGKERRPVPEEVRQRMQGMIWREPVLLPLHALGEAVRYRISPDPELAGRKGSVAVELYPAELPPTTVLIDQRSGRLLEIRHRGRSGQLRTTQLEGHRKVPGGVLVPHRQIEVTGKRRQVVEFTRIELNPQLGPDEIVEGSPSP